MDYYLILIVFIFFSIGFFSVVSDIKRRKVSNVFSFGVILIGLGVFLFGIFFNEYSVYHYLGLLLVFGLAYGFYIYDVWGAADGKIFIGVSFLLLFYGGILLILEFLINLVVFYSFVIVILSFIFTNFKDKINFFVKFNYAMDGFILLVVFSVTYLLGFFFNAYDNFVLLTLFFGVVLVIVHFLQKYVKRFYRKISSDIVSILAFILFVYLIFIGGEIFILYFVVVYIIKMFVKMISQLSGDIRVKDGAYNSPFSIYLYGSAIFSAIAMNNIISILVIAFL